MQLMLVGSAQYAEGDAQDIPAALQLLNKAGIKTQENPDLYVRAYARFGTEDARQLRERASTRAVAGERRVFVVATPSMTTEAQNALLKTLEEPPAGALFFFIVPSPHTLLPTLRSRMQLIVLPGTARADSADAREFLGATPEKRLEMLKPLLEKDDDDKRDLRPILAFLAGLEAALAQHPTTLAPLYSARKYLGDKGALLKPLLEQVALLTPRV